MKTWTWLLSLSALLGACTTPVSASAPVPSNGKPVAPVAVTAEVGAKAARVVVTFESPAEHVSIGVSGVDGLVVEGKGSVVDAGVFARGEAKAFEVAYTPGPGRSQLVVSIAGIFNGGARARVVAFSVGTGPLPEGPGTVTTTDDGQRVRVVPTTP